MVRSDSTLSGLKPGRLSPWSEVKRDASVSKQAIPLARWPESKARQVISPEEEDSSEGKNL